jgi:hypothetical protein
MWCEQRLPCSYSAPPSLFRQPTKYAIELTLCADMIFEPEDNLCSKKD